jgi:hypothetical protein
MSHADDIQAVVPEIEEIAVAVAPALVIDATVVAKGTVTVESVSPRDSAIGVAVQEPEAILLEVTPSPAVTISAAAPEIMVVTGANIGQPGKVGPFREGHTFAVIGTLTGITALPSFFIPKHDNQTVKLAGVFSKLVSGQVNLQIKRNGANVASPVTVTSVKTFTDMGNVSLADGDEISAVLSGAVSAPDTLSATVVLEWSVP